MLSVTYYAQNYAAIIGWSLQVTTKSRTYVVTLDIYLSHSLNLGPIILEEKATTISNKTELRCGRLKSSVSPQFPSTTWPRLTLRVPLDLYQSVQQISAS